MAFCTDCGTLSDEDAAFCPKCGRKFGEENPDATLSALDLATQRPAGKKQLGYTSSLSSRFIALYAVTAFVVLSPLAYFAWMMRDGMPAGPQGSATAIEEGRGSGDQDGSGPGGRSHGSSGASPSGVSDSEEGSRSRAVNLLMEENSPTDFAALEGGVAPDQMASSIGVSVKDLSSMDPRSLAARAQEFMLRSDSDVARRLTAELITRMLAVAYAQDGLYPLKLDSTYEEGLGRPINASVYTYEPVLAGNGYTLTVALSGSYPEDERVRTVNGRSQLVISMQKEELEEAPEGSAAP